MISDYKVVKDAGSLRQRLSLRPVSYLEDEIEPGLAAFIDEAKVKQRSEKPLASWTAANYCDTDVLEKLYAGCIENIDRIEAAEFSVQEFREKYDKANKPCIIQGCLDDKWDFEKNWSWQAFYDRYKDTAMKIAEDDEEKKIKIEIQKYYKYMLHQRDDSPLYMFQSGFNELEGTTGIVKNYQVPKYFKEDFFGYMSEEKRPPYRWFLIGPKRSGSTLHTDPLMTSAWNTSLNGHKLWVMFPWSYPKWVVNGKNMRKPGEDNEAIDYFWHHLQRIKDKEGPLEGMVECIQRPGDTVFVPGGWWHAVLNLDDTMAVTQNFCNSANFERVWRCMRVQRYQLSRYFLDKLKKKDSAHYKKALQLNSQDTFIPFEHRQGNHFLLNISTDSDTNSSSDSSSSSTKSLTSSEEQAGVNNSN